MITLNELADRVATIADFLYGDGMPEQTLTIGGGKYKDIDKALVRIVSKLNKILLDVDYVLCFSLTQPDKNVDQYVATFSLDKLEPDYPELRIEFSHGSGGDNAICDTLE